jgi:hypothetical protein
LDVAQRTEMVEAELTRLIEKRHDQRVKTEGERREEELWMPSSRRYSEMEERQMNAARYAFEMNMCELHERLAVEHEERALRMLEDDSEARKGED